MAAMVASSGSESRLLSNFVTVVTRLPLKARVVLVLSLAVVIVELLSSLHELQAGVSTRPASIPATWKEQSNTVVIDSKAVPNDGVERSEKQQKESSEDGMIFSMKTEGDESENKKKPTMTRKRTKAMVTVSPVESGKVRTQIGRFSHRGKLKAQDARNL